MNKYMAWGVWFLRKKAALQQAVVGTELLTAMLQLLTRKQNIQLLPYRSTKSTHKIPELMTIYQIMSCSILLGNPKIQLNKHYV